MWTLSLVGGAALALPVLLLIQLFRRAWRD